MSKPPFKDPITGADESQPVDLPRKEDLERARAVKTKPDKRVDKFIKRAGKKNKPVEFFPIQFDTTGGAI